MSDGREREFRVLLSQRTFRKLTEFRSKLVAAADLDRAMTMEEVLRVALRLADWEKAAPAALLRAMQEEAEEDDLGWSS